MRKASGALHFYINGIDQGEDEEVWEGDEGENNRGELG